MTDRKWALRKIAAGDYLLPSNDRRTLYRITRGEDDSGQWWDLWRWRGNSLAQELAIAESIVDMDWSNWENIDTPRTRAAAIKEAMRIG